MSMTLWYYNKFYADISTIHSITLNILQHLGPQSFQSSAIQAPILLIFTDFRNSSRISAILSGPTSPVCVRALRLPSSSKTSPTG